MYDSRAWARIPILATLLFSVPMPAALAQWMPVGDSIVVNTTTQNGQIAPSLVTGADGSFRVIWWDEAHRVSSQAFDGGGIRVGTEMQISDASATYLPAASGNRAGEFTVVWNGATGARVRSF